MKIGGANYNFYKNLNYNIPTYKDNKGRIRVKRGTIIVVKVCDLPNQSNVKVTKVCDECGEILKNRTYSSIINLRMNGDGKDRCKKCGMVFLRKKQKENLSFEKSLTYFAEKNNKKYLLEEFSEKNAISSDKVYKSSNLLLIWNCFKCESEYEQYLYNRTCQNTGCPYCAGQRVNHTNCLSTTVPDVAKEWHPTKNGKLTPNDITKNSQKKIWWQCDKGHEWVAKASTRTEGKGCLVCSSSKGEKQVRDWLENNNIEYMSQKEFDGLIGLGGGNLSYDFYVPDQNILIEYQGEFHDGTANQQTKEEFEYAKEHDRRKHQYAIDNNIKLVEIWYWDKNNMEDILKKEIIKQQEEFNVKNQNVRCC